MNPAQALFNGITAIVGVIAVTYLTRRRTYPIEAVFDAGMDYQRRLTSRAASSPLSMATESAA